MHNFKILDKTTVQEISKIKNEPEWMLEYRLKALETHKKQKMPDYGPSLNALDLKNIVFYKSPDILKKTSWEEVPQEIKKEFDRLGLPEAEKKFLAGVEAQVNSEAIYGNLKAGLKEQGIIFTNIEEGLRKHPELFKEYFGKLVKPTDNKFAALNSAVWSGGSFLYVPKNVRVELPLQAYFQIGRINLGQFERTLIIADEGSYIHYIEGCTAPMYSRDVVHAGVAEVFVKPGLIFLSLPITVLTLGLFTLIIDTAVLFMVAYIVPGFRIDTFLTGLLFALVNSVISSLFHRLLK